MDDEKLAGVVGGIPEGCWMSYADVCAAAGGSARQALALNGRLTRLECPGAWRVLKANGTIAPTALGAPERVRELLLEEGVTFEGGKARPAQRLRPAEGVAAEAAAREAAQARREEERAAPAEEIGEVI
ncbi:MAG: MGMT family protein [Actinomycetota bacterium]|nr:MGMT family protein [Actinomycetota bacterium]